jgi:ubiquinone/menaquinone biosynthesis C-methylase UbiE
MRNPIEPFTTAVELRERRGAYGIDAPLTGLLPPTVGGLTLAALSAYHGRRGRRSLAIAELLSSMPMLCNAVVYLHATRRGKFQIWAELLTDLHLRGNEHGLDMGCGRGAVMAMLAKLVPCGSVVGLDLWRTEDQSGNNPEVTRRNLIAEGVAERCELKTGDMLAMPFQDNTFDVVVSSLAIHNIDERELRNHTRRLQAVFEATRVLKPGGRLVITDLLWTRRYAQHLRQLGMHNVEQRSLGWRLWYAPFLGADLVTAMKPPAT